MRTWDFYVLYFFCLDSFWFRGILSGVLEYFVKINIYRPESITHVMSNNYAGPLSFGVKVTCTKPILSGSTSQSQLRLQFSAGGRPFPMLIAYKRARSANSMGNDHSGGFSEIFQIGICYKGGHSTHSPFQI